MFVASGSNKELIAMFGICSGQYIDATCKLHIKHYALFFYRSREAIVAQAIELYHLRMEEDPADLEKMYHDVLNTGGEIAPERTVKLLGEL